MKQVEPKSAKQVMTEEDAAKTDCQAALSLHGGKWRCVIYGYSSNKKDRKIQPVGLELLSETKRFIKR